jgi:hypothetical protein
MRPPPAVAQPEHKTLKQSTVAIVRDMVPSFVMFVLN